MGINNERAGSRIARRSPGISLLLSVYTRQATLMRALSPLPLRLFVERGVDQQVDG